MSDLNKRAAISKKIQALFAKTVGAGCTEAEALEAAMKAAALQAEYNITLTEVELLEEGFLKVEVPWTSVKAQFIEDFLIVPVATFTSTRGWVYRPVLNSPLQLAKKDVYKTVFCGLRSDALFAQWLLVYLRDFISRQASFRVLVDPSVVILNLSKRERNEYYKSFVLGAVKRIVEKLNNSKQEPIVQSNDGRALVVLDKHALIQEFIDTLGISLRSQGAASATIKNRAAFEAGNEVGLSANLNRPINHTGKTELLK